MAVDDDWEFLIQRFSVTIVAIVVLGKIDQSIFVVITNLEKSFDCSRTILAL